MSCFLILAAVVLVIAAIAYAIRVSQAADPECDRGEGEEEIVAMGGQVDDSAVPPEESSEEEDSQT